MTHSEIHIPQCGNTHAHEPHAYERQFTTRRCDGLAKLEHFCGDRTAHKRHENATHFCPGISRREIMQQSHELRRRMRVIFEVAVPLNVVRRDYSYWLAVTENAEETLKSLQTKGF